MKKIDGHDVKILTDRIDDNALEQIKTLLLIDVFADKKIRIIPLNMHDGSLICTGKGNSDWNCSAPHGAGRVLSCTQAYEKIKMEDFEASMAGIYSESVNDFTRDESPMVYKAAVEITANIGDTVTIDAVIRPVFNFKASK